MSKEIRVSQLTDVDEITAIDRFLLRLWGNHLAYGILPTPLTKTGRNNEKAKPGPSPGLSLKASG
jgi:hypothetical protein